MIYSKNEKHFFMLYGSVGKWYINLLDKNNDAQVKLGIGYLRGKNRHHFEMNAGITTHLIRSIDTKQFLHGLTLPHFFVGYRYQNFDQRFFFRGGIGFFELLQIGIGLKLQLKF